MREIQLPTLSNDWINGYYSPWIDETDPWINKTELRYKALLKEPRIRRKQIIWHTPRYILDDLAKYANIKPDKYVDTTVIATILLIHMEHESNAKMQNHTRSHT